MAKPVTRIVLIVLGVAAYVGAAWYMNHALENYPWVFISTFTVGFVFLIVVGTRFSNREEQRRSVWSSLRDLSKGELASVPENADETKSKVFCHFGEVLFNFINMTVNECGIKLDRTLALERPIVIPWRTIQRLDLITLAGMPMFKGKNIEPASRIFLASSDGPLIIYPWPRELLRFVPENIGSSEYKPTADP